MTTLARQQSTNPKSAYAPDDRPITRRQDPKTKRWEALRVDSRFPEGGKIIARDLPTRAAADEAIEKERRRVPQTDRSVAVTRNRSQFTFDVPQDKWDRIFGGGS